MKLISTCFFIASLCGLSAIPSGTSGQHFARQDTSKPNIIIIISDDLGWNDIGYNGSFIKTPHMDNLARGGIRLDQHYVAPTCTPTRVALMTGRYPSRYGILGPDYGEVIYKGDPTLASVLAESGYATAIAGKWHMGSPPHTPMAYGFESSYGYLDGQIDPYTHEYKTGPNSWHRNDKLLQEEGHATDLITKEAVRIIERARTEPFFLYVAYSVPHHPLQEPEEWTSRYDHLNLHPSRKQFAASVTHMDDGIGKIVDALERTGQRDNTLIVFTSDNGGQRMWVDNKEYGGKYADKPHLVLGNNFPLRGWKGDLYEGGIRVPAFASWPGHLEAGAANFPIHAVDWLPSLFALTGTEPGNLKLDGKNIWPQLSQGVRAVADRKFYWKTDRMSAVRAGDWKLVVTQGEQPMEELFNLEDDFREARDIAEKHPEKKAELLQLMKVFEQGDGKKRVASKE